MKRFIFVLLTTCLIQQVWAAEEHKAEEKNEKEEKFIIYHKEAPTLTRGRAPLRPKLLNPEPLKAISEMEVTLKWSPVDEADAYSLQVSDDSNFFKLIVNEPQFAQTEYNLKGLEKDKIYYWRVAALKSENKPGSMKSLYNRSSFSTK